LPIEKLDARYKHPGMTCVNHQSAFNIQQFQTGANMAKILIIDDDPDIVLAARLCLESAGHKVFDANNSTKGLGMLDELQPELIILDVMMSTTTEGFQTALQLRSPDPGSPYAAYRDIPLLMMTAIHSTTDLRFAPDQAYLPVDAFIDKPIDPDVLIKKVNALLAQKK
jgi:CheY-like chemotaxis protein